MNAYTTARPETSEYALPYGTYVEQVPGGDILETLEHQIEETLGLLREVSEERGERRYAPGKWSIKEVVAHVIDAERVFAYRALRFARNDATPLPSFDENEYARYNRAGTRALRDLIEELAAVRRANLHLFRSLSEDELGRRGVASGREVTVRALLWIVAGHERHHVRLLRERYL